MLKLYNSLTRSIKLFKPIKPGVVHMYSCGPTVYDHAHIGNLRAYIFADTLQRVLRHIEDYKLTWVMNITDVDDKMIKRAKKDYPDITPNDALDKLAEIYTKVFYEDIQKVGINPSDVSTFTRATQHIESMQKLIEHLLREGIAYISAGSVYFSLDAYKKSGKVYGQLVDLDYTPQARIIDDQDQKEGVGDFALWKAQKLGEPSWDFNWLGKNYPGHPGWHIECSAMSTQYLGHPFDIHTGGVDNKFPHHENEIAQCGGLQANFFVHNEHLNANSTKMSKSLGNFITIADIENPIVFRLAVLQAHYRSQMDYNDDIYEAAQNRLHGLKTYIDQMIYAWPNQLPQKDTSKATTDFITAFTAAMREDLNTPAALAALSAIESKVYSQQTLKAMKQVDTVLGLQLFDQPKLSQPVKSLITHYDEAKTHKQYIKSDALRETLRNEHRIVVVDSVYGPLVSRLFN